MLSSPILARSRFGLPAVVVAVAAVLWWGSTRTPVIDAEYLTADGPVRRGAKFVVIGEWVTAAPSESGHVVVVLRGRDGGRVACHFEEVPAADRLSLERCLQ